MNALLYVYIKKRFENFSLFTLSKTQKTEVTTTLAEDKHSADVSTEQVDTAAQEEAKKVEAEQAAAQEEAKRIEAEQAAAQEEAIYPLSIHY
jgi:hypothetical protein